VKKLHNESIELLKILSSMRKRLKGDWKRLKGDWRKIERDWRKIEGRLKKDWKGLKEDWRESKINLNQSNSIWINLKPNLIQSASILNSIYINLKTIKTTNRTKNDEKNLLFIQSRALVAERPDT
jgi:hypothetical protein